MWRGEKRRGGCVSRRQCDRDCVAWKRSEEGLGKPGQHSEGRLLKFGKISEIELRKAQTMEGGGSRP